MDLFTLFECVGCGEMNGYHSEVVLCNFVSVNWNLKIKE